MQVSTVRMHMKAKELNISAIYCPPKYKTSKQEYVELFKMLGKYYIIGGDFNAEHTYWGSKLTTAKGRIFYKAGRETKSNFYSTGTPSYWPTDLKKLPDLMNFYVVKGLSNNYIKVEEGRDLVLDHVPIILTISTSLI